MNIRQQRVPTEGPHYSPHPANNRKIRPHATLAAPERALQSGSDAYEEKEPAGGGEFDPTTELPYADVMQKSGHGEFAYTRSRFPQWSTACRALHMINMSGRTGARGSSRAP
jgi:hypothetical protein